MDAGAPEADAHESGAQICFHTKRRTRLAATLYAVLVTFAIEVVALVLSAGVASEVLGLPPVAAGVLVCVVISLVSAICWKLVSPRLRFRIVFHPDQLQVGGGLVARRFPYEDVDTVSRITVSSPWGEDSWIRVKCGRRTARVHLDAGAIDRCLMLVRHCCPNAMVIDRDGRVSLPANPTRPAQTLSALEHHLRKKARLLVLAGFGAAGVATWFIWRLIEHATGRQRLDDVTVVKSCLVVAFLLAGLPFLPRAAWRCWRAASEIRDKRTNKSAQPGTGGKDDRASFVD